MTTEWPMWIFSYFSWSRNIKIPGNFDSRVQAKSCMPLNQCSWHQLVIQTTNINEKYFNKYYVSLKVDNSISSNEKDETEIVMLNFAYYLVIIDLLEITDQSRQNAGL